MTNKTMPKSYMLLFLLLVILTAAFCALVSTSDLSTTKTVYGTVVSLEEGAYLDPEKPSIVTVRLDDGSYQDLSVKGCVLGIGDRVYSNGGDWYPYKPYERNRQTDDYSVGLLAVIGHAH